MFIISITIYLYLNFTIFVTTSLFDPSISTTFLEIWYFCSFPLLTLRCGYGRFVVLYLQVKLLSKIIQSFTNLRLYVYLIYVKVLSITDHRKRSQEQHHCLLQAQGFQTCYVYGKRVARVATDNTWQLSIGKWQKNK